MTLIADSRPWLIESEQVQTSAGIGNWEAFHPSPFTVHDILAASAEWKEALAGVEKPWLCWNVDEEWCLVQQQLVRAVGWTPVVGFDPRVGKPALVPGAICIDFNRQFGFRTMYPHFPLEFAFAFAPRLAFWHSDLLVPLDQLRRYAERFERLNDRQIVAVEPARPFKDRLLRLNNHRAWELIGCVSRGGSHDNFMTGCGWWACFYLHPMHHGHAERQRKVRHYWDHGTGIMYWRNHCGGDLDLIPEMEVDPGHFTRLRRRATYKVAGHDDWRRDLGNELSVNFSLRAVCASMGLGEIYEQTLHHAQR